MVRQLGELENAVMTRVWRWNRPVTVREVLLDLRTEREIAYTTVMTVLDKLYRKGWLRRERAGRAYLYAPVATREAYTASLMNEAWSTSDNPAAALVHFFGMMSAEQRAALRDALRVAGPDLPSGTEETPPPGRDNVPPMEVTIRRARTTDVRAVRRLIDSYSRDGILLDKPTVALFESVQEFWVAERDEDGTVVACGALHVMWEDLAEVRTLAVDPICRGHGIGHRLLGRLLETARWLGVRRIFCLTFEVAFFAKHGFVEIGETDDGTTDPAVIATEVYEELLRSYDEGVAEFLDLERVKPNTLGNSRMLLHL